MEENNEFIENSVDTPITENVVETLTTTIDEIGVYILRKETYSFLDESILNDKDKLFLFDHCVDYIKITYVDFDKYAKGSCIFIINKLILHNLVIEDNFRSEIDKFMNYLNTEYNNYVSGFRTRFTKNHFMRKFSDKYLSENYEQICKVQED